MSRSVFKPVRFLKPDRFKNSLLLYALVPLAVLFAAIALACLLAYFIRLGIPTTQIPFRKIISKTTQVFLVLSIFPAMHYLRINKSELGFASWSVFGKQLLQGFSLGFVTLFPVFVVLTLLHINVLKPNQDWLSVLLSAKTLIALLLALLISLIEEPLFRGIVLVGLRKKLPVTTAILLSAFYYAFPHLLSRGSDIPSQELTLLSGFSLLSDALHNLLNPDSRSAFFALLMVGIFLGLLRTRISQSLGWCIGCHTCWVWQIKMNKTLFNPNYDADYAYLVSHYDGVIGWLVAGWLAVAVSCYLIYVQKSNKFL